MTRAAVVAAFVVAAALQIEPARAQEAGCSTQVDAPADGIAWRAKIDARIAVFDRVPGSPGRRLSPNHAPWLLVVGRPRAVGDRCWVRVRLPWRPNHASGWIAADKVKLQRTPWRIAVDRQRRTLSLYRAGRRVRSVRVVVGKPSTPTPRGLFAITWATRWRPHDFYGSWVLELTAHSPVLQRYEGGDGTVGIHGRGGESLADPLGTARSHGCVRLSNDAIDWLVRTIGAHRLPGTPVTIR